MKRVIAATIAFLASLLVTSILIRLAGQAPSRIYALLIVGTWGNAYGIGQVLFKATPLLFTGMSVAFAQRAGLFNVGAEGQIIFGAFACAVCGAALPASVPWAVAVPCCLLAAAVGGAVIGIIPGLLKALRGVHEVISTIMLNLIVRAMMVGLGAVFFVKEIVHTRPIGAASALPRLASIVPALHGSAANVGLFIGLAMVFVMAWMLERTRLGFRIRAVGAQPKVAAAAGIHVARTAVVAFAIAGALAGLGGSSFVLGYKGYYEDGFSGGVGFVGIAVAVLGGARPLATIVAALLFGTLAQGALAVNAACPKEIIDVLQAILIIAAATATAAAVRAKATR